MTRLFANPYNIEFNGFYFETLEEYNERSAKIPTEEYEIEFIDGEEIDCALFKASRVHQGNFGAYLDACDEWTEEQKRKVILAVGEAGYKFDLGKDDPDSLDVDIYELDSLKELAEQFAEEGLFGEIPENIRHYLDYALIARDLSADYSEAMIAGLRLVYRCS